MAALHKGNTKGVADDGLYLGMGCPKGAAGKLEAGKAIYGSDGKTGGTDAFVAHKSLLMGCYVSSPAASTRLLRQTAQHMQGQKK